MTIQELIDLLEKLPKEAKIYTQMEIGDPYYFLREYKLTTPSIEKDEDHYIIS